MIFDEQLSVSWEDRMECPACSMPHSEAARFCARCGAPLHARIDRADHFTALPDESVRALAVISTLMPHLSGRHHGVYRHAIAVALLAALTAAAFGVLAVALVLAAVALPAVVLVYIHDHQVWRDEPVTVIGGGFLLSLALGVAVGALDRCFAKAALLAAPTHQLPSLTRILELGVLVPVIAYVAVLIAPLIVTTRSAFRHPMDALVTSSLSGAALSLGASVVVQSGAFSHGGVISGDPAQTAFIALTQGFLQPIIFATAAAVTVIRLRRPGASPAVGVAQGLALLLCYDLARALLGPYGARGIMLTTVVALLLAVAGLLAVRVELHNGLLAEAQAALSGAAPLFRSAGADQPCAHCGAALIAGGAFCQVCGMATAAQGRYVRPPAAVVSSEPSA